MNFILHPTLNKYLVISTKIAVNAILMSLYPVYQNPASYDYHSHAGLIHLLTMVGAAILVREGMVWVPRIAKWSQTDVDPDSAK